MASSVNRRPHDGKEDSAGAMRPCSRPLQTHVACAVLLASSTPLVGSVRLARVSRLAGSWLQPAIASHHRLALGPVPRALDGCAAATCTAPRAVPVRPSRASYSSLSQEQWPVANMATKRPYRACTSLMDAAIWAGPLERVRSSCLLELCPFSLLCDHCGPVWLLALGSAGKL